MKKPTLKSAKAKARYNFKAYIRVRDALATTKSVNYCICCTCEKTTRLDGSLHAGHFTQGSHNSTYFEETNVHGQCLTKESNILMFNGVSKSIKDIRKGDKLWAFHKETYEKTKSEVLDTAHFIPKDLYKVELENGKCFYATGDHKVVANKKWVSIYDMLHNQLAYDISEA